MTLIILAAVILSIAGTVFFGNMSFYSKSAPQEDDIIFDLSDYDFEGGDTAYLNGKWYIYKDALVVSEGGTDGEASAVLDIPFSWYDAVAGNGFIPRDKASYVCYIKNVNSDEFLSMFIKNIPSAYRIYINDVLVSYNGNLSGEDIWTEAAHNDLPFTLQKDGVYRLAVETRTQNNLGLYMPVQMSDYSSANARQSMSVAFRFLVCGIVFSCAVIFIVLKYTVNRDLYSLWLPVLSFILLLRLFLTNEGFAVMQKFFGDISYDVIGTFSFVLTFIIKLTALIYITKNVKIKVADNVYVLFSAIFLVLSLGVNFFPDTVFNAYYHLLLQLVSVIIDIYIINKLCIEIVKKTDYARLYLLSYIFIVVGVLIDVFFTNGIIHANCSSVMPVCFLLFVIFTAIIHALRIKKLFEFAIQAEKFEIELEKANTSLMLSQIQPHFMYNALNTIKSLIRKDPEKAEKAVIDFSMYLRGNMDSLTKTDPIPFSEELAHIKHYCNIEQLRFGDKLDVFYEIGTDEFYVPTLSVQPIVENAIKHGVTKKAEGGSVTIITDEDKYNYYLTVEDDGVGFDVVKALKMKDDKRSHVGIKNVKERLEVIMNAEVDIQSEPGKGSKVVITLPKDKNVKTLQESLEFQEKTIALEEMEI